MNGRTFGKRTVMAAVIGLLTSLTLLPTTPAAAATLLAHTCAVIGSHNGVQAVHCADVLRSGNTYYGQSQHYCQQILGGQIIACEFIIGTAGSYSSRSGAHYSADHSCGVGLPACTQVRLYTTAPPLGECGYRIRGRAVDSMIQLKDGYTFGGIGTSIETAWVTQSC